MAASVCDRARLRSRGGHAGIAHRDTLYRANSRASDVGYSVDDLIAV